MNIWITTHTHQKKNAQKDAPCHTHRLGLWHLLEQWFYEWITLFCARLKSRFPSPGGAKITHLALHAGSACCEWRGPFSDRRRIVSLTLWCPCWELFTPLFSAYFTKLQNFRARGIFPNLSTGFCTSIKIKSNISHWVSSLFSHLICAHQTKNTFFICVCVLQVRTVHTCAPPRHARSFPVFLRISAHDTHLSEASLLCYTWLLL